MVDGRAEFARGIAPGILTLAAIKAGIVGFIEAGKAVGRTSVVPVFTSTTIGISVVVLVFSIVVLVSRSADAGFGQSVVVPAEAAEQGAKYLLAVQRSAAELTEGDGVGRRTAKDGLVDVQPDARHAARDGWPGEVVFDEHSADFPVADVHVVRPLHRDVVGVSGHGVGHR